MTPEADERDVLVTLIKAYENKHFDFGPKDPVEPIKFWMEQQGLTARDLEQFILETAVGRALVGCDGVRRQG